jgi:hypothetical protein
MKLVTAFRLFFRALAGDCFPEQARLLPVYRQLRQIPGWLT